MGLTTKVVRGENAERLLLLMHGIGSNENDLAGLAQHVDPDGRYTIVCPRGPYAYGPGFAWFRMEAPATVESALDAVDEVVDSSLAQFDMKREEMVVGGFSMGAAMSLLYGFRGSDKTRPAGLLAMSGFLPADPESLDWSGDLPAVLMQHGTRDPMVPLHRALDAKKALEEHGVPLVFREYPMEHTVSPESARDVQEWLDQIRRGEKPTGIYVQVAAEPETADDGPVQTVTSRTFDQVVLQSDKPVIVDFWAPWCGPCRAVAPVVEQIAEMRKGNYLVVKLNIDEAPDIAKRYDVQSIPLIGLFRNGRLERKSLGAKPRPQLEAELGMLVIP